jgi:flagellar protein FliO/FliZ
VVGATEEHVTLLAEVDGDAVALALRDRRGPARADAGAGAHAPGLPEDAVPALAARSSSGALAGSVFDGNGWGTFVHQLRERTVRKP